MGRTHRIVDDSQEIREMRDGLSIKWTHLGVKHLIRLFAEIWSMKFCNPQPDINSIECRDRKLVIKIRNRNFLLTHYIHVTETWALCSTKPWGRLVGTVCNHVRIKDSVCKRWEKFSMLWSRDKYLFSCGAYVFQHSQEIIFSCFSTYWAR